MQSSLRLVARTRRHLLTNSVPTRLAQPQLSRAFAISAAARMTTTDQGTKPAPPAPSQESENLRTGKEAPTFLGTQKRLPEFQLVDKVCLVSGAARGLGLTQAEALLEAGATGERQKRA